MKETLNYLISAINLGVLLRYCWLIYFRKITPSLAMWVFFFIAVVLSMTTYLARDNYSWTDNILNATDLFLTGTVSAFIILFGKKESLFNKFDFGCLVSVILVVFFWMFSKEHFISNIATQVILIIAYVPVVKRMIVSKENSESFTIWIAMFMAPFISIFCSEGILATIYLFRAMFCTGLLLSIMLWIKIINKKAPIK